MSSLSIDHLVMVEQDRVSWVAQGRLPATAPWRECLSGTPLEACARLLDDVPRGRLRSLDSATVLLGFPHVQYLVVPWQAGLYTPAHWEGFAQALFTQNLDLDPRQWQITLDHAPYGAPRLAVATRQAWLQDLRLLFKVRRLPIRTCEPLLTAAWARHRRALPTDFELAVSEPHGLSCLFGQAGQAAQVSALHIANPDALADNVLAARILANAPQRETLLICAAENQPAQGLAPPWRWLGPAHPWLTESFP